MTNSTNNIEDFINPEKSEKKKREPKTNWEAFVQGEVVNFFEEHGLMKLAIEDDSGNKAKLTRQKSEEIKVECSSTTIV